MPTAPLQTEPPADSDHIYRRREWLRAAAAGLAVAATGCPDSSPNPLLEDDATNNEQPQTKLRLAVVDDAPLADAIKRQWKARASSELEIVTLSVDDLRKRDTLSTDAVIYPNGMMGELMQKQMLTRLEENLLDDHAFAQSDLFSLPRIRESNWGVGVVGVPLGSPVFTVIIRGDLLGGEPPQTWADYSQLASRARDQKPESVENWLGAGEPLKGRWAAEVLLARAATYARRRDTLATLFDTTEMEPLVATPPFERALNELVEVAKTAPDSLDWTPNDASQAVLSGRCGLTLGWLPPTLKSENIATSEIIFAELPGGREVYDRRKAEWATRDTDNEGRVTLVGVSGRIGSVTRLSSNPKEAFRMLALISSSDWSRRIIPESAHAAPFRTSQMRNSDAWLPELPGFAKPHAEAIESSLNRSDWLFSPRLAGRDQYLDALAESVRSAAKGDVSPAEALKTASDSWRSITTELGVERQRKSYLASLVR